MAKDGHLVKGKDCILPTAQVKGVCLSMKLLHQGLSQSMPHGTRWNAKKSLKSLLHQEGTIACMSTHMK